jgi:hypothetical protein
MFERLQVPVVWSDRLDAAYLECWSALRRDRDHAGQHNLVHDLELKRLRSELDASRDRDDCQRFETAFPEKPRVTIPGI